MSTDPILPPEPSRHSVVPVSATDENFVPPFSEGQLLLDKYQIKGVIGTGGIGYVMSAVNIALEEPVALKFLRPEFLSNEEAVHRFMTEARLASKVQNLHVTRVLDVCTLPEHGPFIVMELLVGRDLNQVLQEQGPLNTEAAVNYVLEVCEGLAAAHTRNVLHRDVKPDNLFLTRQPYGPDIIKILDFGISKLQLERSGANAEPSPFRTTTALGSPSYMSPEQIRADPNIDARTDVWSLGCVLYELLAGEHAFNAPTLMQICAIVLERPAPSIRAHAPNVPAEIERIILRCLEKEPELRFSNVAELAAALAPFGSSAARCAVERCSEILGQATPELPEAGRVSQLAFPPPPLPTLMDEPLSSEAHAAPESVRLVEPAPFSTAPVALDTDESASPRAWFLAARQNWVAYTALAAALVALVGPNLRNAGSASTEKPSLAAAVDQHKGIAAPVEAQTTSKPDVHKTESEPAIKPEQATTAAATKLGSSGRKARPTIPSRAYQSASASMSSRSLGSATPADQAGASSATALDDRLHVPSTLARPGQNESPLTVGVAPSASPDAVNPSLNAARPSGNTANTSANAPQAATSSSATPNLGNPQALTPSVMAEVARAHASEVQACVNWAQADDSPRRKLALVVTIDAEGSVILAQPAPGFEGSAQLVECLVATTKRWKFPAHPGATGLSSYTIGF